MSDERQLRDDLSYVRTALQRAQDSDGPATIYFLWAVITFFGYAMIDYVPEKTGFYWMIAGPAGGVLSGILGWRAGRTLGQSSRRHGRVHMLHWTGTAVAILLIVLLSASGRVDPDELPRLILLLVALSYFTAGIHMDRRLLWVGVAVAGCYVFTVLAHGVPYLWTITAAVLSASLVAAGLFAAARTRQPD